MKALKTNPLVVIAIPLLMVAMISVSCTKDKKPTYSCNPKINKWVIENLGAINNASRSQLSELPLPFQKASYQSLSPERKYELWNEKLEDATCASMNAGLCIKENTCNQTPDGCGLLWQYPCKGECENHMVVIDDEQ